MKRFFLAFLAALCIAAPAVAQKAYMVLTKENWVYHGAVADFDFVNELYYDHGKIADIKKYFLVTRVSTAANSASNLFYTSPSGASFVTYPNNTLRIVHGVGLITELGRTNQLLNSAAPATQTTGTLVTSGVYTLWVNGSGSATMSNGTTTNCVGTATQGNPIVFTAGTAGTCVVTVTGSLNQFQLEQNAVVSSVPTSFITTAGATAFRAVDSYQFPTGGAIQQLSASGTGTVMCQLTRPHPNVTASCFASNSGSLDRFLTSGSGGLAFTSVSHGNVLITAVDGGPSDPTTDKVAVAWDGTGRCMVWNGGTPVCDGNTFAPTNPVWAFATNGGQNPTTPGKRLTFWSTRLSSASLQALTK